MLNPTLSAAYYTIQNVNTSTLLDSDKNGKVYLQPANGGLNQVWLWDGAYLTDIATALVLVTDTMGTVNTKYKNGDGYQKWIITASDGGFKIRNNATGRFLDLNRVFKYVFTSTSDKPLNPVWNLIYSLVCFL